MAISDGLTASGGLGVSNGLGASGLELGRLIPIDEHAAYQEWTLSSSIPRWKGEGCIVPCPRAFSSGRTRQMDAGIAVNDQTTGDNAHFILATKQLG